MHVRSSSPLFIEAADILKRMNGDTELEKKKKRTLTSEALISSTDFIHRCGSVVITKAAMSKSICPIYDHKDSFMQAD